jgi:hypothetical protein
MFTFACHILWLIMTILILGMLISLRSRTRTFWVLARVTWTFPYHYISSVEDVYFCLSNIVADNDYFNIRYCCNSVQSDSHKCHFFMSISILSLFIFTRHPAALYALGKRMLISLREQDLSGRWHVLHGPFLIITDFHTICTECITQGRARLLFRMYSIDLLQDTHRLC